MDKRRALEDYLAALGSVAVAFSGGVDSTFLLKIAHDVLGERVLAVTARSPAFPHRELAEAAAFCRSEGIRHSILDAEELRIDGFAQNPPNRCYLCKRELLVKIRAIAEENGIAHVVEGSNVDDDGDYRPGLEAVKELCVKSPLRAVGLSKQEIRDYSRQVGLNTWDKPSFACLFSRFPYGEEITAKKLHMVDQAEQFLLDAGFRQMRVRIHGEIARIEVLPHDLERLLREREAVVAALRRYGFLYVTMDLQGYRTGSMNDMLQR